MKTQLFLCIIALSLTCSQAHAMGAKKPSTPKPVETPTTPTPPTPPNAPSGITPTLDFGPDLSPDEYLNASAQSGPEVDDEKKGSELSGKQRKKINDDKVDKCFSDENSHEYFSDQISYYAAEMLSDVPAKVGFIGSYYGTSSDDSRYFPTSLIRHPLCLSTAASLKTTMKNNVPSNAVIEKLNRFANNINDLRSQVLEGDQSAKKELLSSWSKFFSCLSYSESLSTADMTASQNVANKVAPSGYRKPAGVKFYEDKEQPAASRLNIGMFQFTPDSAGNIQPCIRAWNELHATKPQCLVNQKSSQSELVKVLGSSLQGFNAFCGIHKLIQTFAIQVNTNKASGTHPSNVINGKFKPFEERCVTPHFYRGWAYNHFGPFQNSTGRNLDELFTCTLNSH